MVENTTVSALCARIHESVIEACVFEVGDHIYIGDWDTSGIDTACGDTISPFNLGPGMYTVEVSNQQLKGRRASNVESSAFPLGMYAYAYPKLSPFM